MLGALGSVHTNSPLVEMAATTLLDHRTLQNCASD
jgi:hypothetical protein